MDFTKCKFWDNFILCSVGQVPVQIQLAPCEKYKVICQWQSRYSIIWFIFSFILFTIVISLLDCVLLLSVVQTLGWIDNEIVCLPANFSTVWCALTDRPTDRPTDGLTDWLTDWQTDGATDCLTDWWNDWLTGWLMEWLTDWLTDGLTGWRSDWLTGWLMEWLADGMTDWLTDWWNDWLAGGRTV